VGRVAAAADDVRHVELGVRARSEVLVGQADPVALDRVAEHDQQPRVRRRARQQRRRPRVVHVARPPLAADRAGAAREQRVVARDVGLVHRVRAELVEEVVLGVRAGPGLDVRMLEQHAEPARGGGPERADADEVGRPGAADVSG
jgi:hypothetical protein